MKNVLKLRSKFFVITMLAATLLCFLVIFSAKDCCSLKPEKENLQQSFIQHPPIAIKFFLQKLKTPAVNGENIVFSIQYASDTILPPQIKIYKEEKIDLVLKDDGVYPDQLKGDKKYTAYKKEGIPKMLDKIQMLEENLARKKHVLNFTGHVGEVVNAKNIRPFNIQAFQDFREVEVSALLINAVDCDADLLKEKSLFITDIAIVEDQSRTYNVVTGVGNPNGVWTFGTLMDNIENNTHPDGLRGFLKDWVKHWITVQTVNGQSIEAREFAMDNMIRPWLAKAGMAGVDLSNWETAWDAIPENALKINAPFKLTAIVNRIDLRGNAAYNSSLTNAGETRFIFTLINPVDGSIPINPRQTAEAQMISKGLFDWRGMNVIFEYGNPQTNRCQLKNFAQQWLDLSDQANVFGTPATNNNYKIALQAITDQVTSANAAPTKINGSAINRIRTNEKAFATFDHPGITDPHTNWEMQDWEFRQFALGATSHRLEMVPLTNNPPHTANYAPNIEEDYTATNQSVTNQNIINWIFGGHKQQVLHGNFNLPNNLLAGSGIVRREETQFFALLPNDFMAAGGYAANPSVEAKKIRQQFSINTCAGCHAGDTKTVFTHVNALAYGEEAKYWLSTIDGASNTPALRQDDALYPWGTSGPLRLGGRNQGTTYDPAIGNVVNLDAEIEITPRTFFQSVSPFLTGRRYIEQYPVSNLSPTTWEDDNIDGSEFPSDQSLVGLFYVNDPANDSSNPVFPYMDDQKWGFNDLERRKNDLCTFVNSNCSTLPHSVFDLMAMIRFTPFPEGAH